MATLPEFTDALRLQHRAAAYLDFVKAVALDRPLATLPDTPAHAVFRKAAVDLGDDALRLASAAFLRTRTPRSVLDQLVGAVSLPPFSPVFDLDPGDVHGSFVGQAAAIPVTIPEAVSLSLDLHKLGAIVLISRRLLERDDTRVRRWLEQILAVTLTTAEDAAFLSTAPATAAAPAGLLHGVTPMPSTGSLADDLHALFTAITGGRPISPAVIASPATAAWVAASAPGAVSDGPRLLGVPLVLSAQAGATLIALDQAGLVYTDEGLSVDVSTAGALDVGVPPATGPAATVAIWQTNSSAIRLVRYVSWLLTRADAVAALLVGPSGS